MYHSFVSAAALLAFLPTTFAAGTAHVVSNCDFDVYFASVSQNVGAAMQKLPAGGYSESYTKPNDGISIKISTSPNGPVTQFEFTWDSPNINYDISHINGNPFEQYGSSLVPSGAGASGYPTCVALSCPAGDSVCSDAYNQPDDVQTRVCPDSSDLTFTLCPGGSSGAAPSVSSAQSSVAAPSAAIPSSASQPGFSVPAASPSSQPAFSKSAAAPSAPVASSPAAIPTSFQTFTTPAAGRPASSSFQAQVSSPVAASAVQSPPAAAPDTTPAAEATAPAATHSWSWGNWGHQHTRRAHAHSHRFRL